MIVSKTWLLTLALCLVTLTSVGMNPVSADSTSVLRMRVARYLRGSWEVLASDRQLRWVNYSDIPTWDYCPLFTRDSTGWGIVAAQELTHFNCSIVIVKNPLEPHYVPLLHSATGGYECTHVGTIRDLAEGDSVALSLVNRYLRDDVGRSVQTDAEYFGLARETIMLTGWEYPTLFLTSVDDIQHYTQLMTDQNLLMLAANNPSLAERLSEPFIDCPLPIGSIPSGEDAFVDTLAFCLLRGLRNEVRRDPERSVTEVLIHTWSPVTSALREWRIKFSAAGVETIQTRTIVHRLGFRFRPPGFFRD